jgi:hypothetical protein
MNANALRESELDAEQLAYLDLEDIEDEENDDEDDADKEDDERRWKSS